MRREDEAATLAVMLGAYCARRHGGKEPCESCAELLAYARKRLAACRYGEDKPTCARCPTHCYEPGHRERIREAMRSIGPRMLFIAPRAALRHALHGLSRLRKPR
ncbi:MAG TPA: nitrous oxide-stimulated promoter family protein [Spirochaetia bacterium]|nr:nitrous oxide-stimulated promoter family protein [Spirochaetales bacterium]HRY72168.1 nitrous oxide-stimulated promoter family protein [Spirochaetia bacterium]